MNKTITINIGGVVFNIDEVGYSILDKYLINLRNHFGDDATSAEIVSDIELRIAEIFNDRTGANKITISKNDVKDVINSMGQPEQFYDDTIEIALSEKISTAQQSDIAPISTENSKQNKVKTKKIPRKLMRDGDDRVVGGVSAGIAHYFNINVILVRLVYFILLAVFGIGLIPYLLLWLVVPKATSTIDKLKMRGQAVNIETIAQSNRIEAIEKAKPQTSSQHFSNILAKLFSKFGSFCLAFLRMMLLLIAVAGLASLVAILVTIGYGFFMGSDNLFSFFIESKLFIWMSALSGLVFLSIPILFLVFAIILLLFNRRIWNKQLVLILFGFWLISAVLFGLNIWDFSKDFKVVESFSEDVLLNINKNKRLYLDADDALLESKKYLFSPNIVIMSQTFRLDEDSIYLINPSLKIEESADNEFHIILNMESRAKTKEAAVKRMQQIVPNFKIINNKLILGNYAAFYKESLYRLQKFNYVIQVPKNGKITLSENVIRLFANITDEIPQTVYEGME